MKNRFYANTIKFSIIFLVSWYLASSAFATGPKIQKEAAYFKSLQEDVAWFEKAETQVSLNDNRSLFLRVYHTVTLEMPNMFAEQQFENPEWVRKLMLKYVSLYRNALECSLNENCEVAPTWQYAFSQNHLDKKPAALQLLFSISAHVNRDLPVALAEIDTDFTNESLHRDFQKISLIFQRRMPQLIEVAQDYQHCSLNKVERKLVNRIILWAMNSTREQAWNYGIRLAQVKTNAEESTLMAEIEAHAAKEDKSIRKDAPVPEFLMCL